MPHRPGSRLHRPAQGGPSSLPANRPALRLSDDVEDGDDDAALTLPSDARRRLAANRTVGAFDHLRRAEVAKRRLAEQKAEEQRLELERPKQRQVQAKRARNLSAVNALLKQEEYIEAGNVESTPTPAPSPPRQVITIKDESDEEDVKPLLGPDGIVLSPRAGHSRLQMPPPRTPSPRPEADARQASPLGVLDRVNATSDPLSLPLFRAQTEQPDEHDRQSSAAPLAETPAPFEIPSREELPWPEHFERLEEVFKALNTVYAFCSSRKHLATTFDTMRSSVEALIRRDLEIYHIAQLKSLLPDLISFAYVDAELLEVHLDGAPGGADGGPSDARKKAAMLRRAETDSAYEEAARLIALEGIDGSAFEAGGVESETTLTGPAVQAPAPLLPSVSSLQYASREVAAAAAAARKRSRAEEHVLLFEFRDGTLQGPKATARGRPGMRRGPSKKPGGSGGGGNKKEKYNPSLDALPSTGSMKRLIDKRNAKFETAVCELLAACHAKGEDAVALLVSAANDHVPIDPQTAERPGTGETPQKKKIRLDYLMSHPDERPEIKDVIEEMHLAPWWVDQVVPGGRRTIPAREAHFDGLTFALSQELVNALWSTRNIEDFYMHQAEALNALEDGLNVIVSTSTSSGKSLIYQIPIVRALEEDAGATALFIFPTKALAQDQKRSLQDLIRAHELLDEHDVVVATYDGDTEKDLRADIRARANIIFTNPDMLHQSILPNEHHWRRFLRGLKYVVVDELHSYNGLFGAHVSLIMRRLRRICNALGNRRIQFVSCSATVANPRQHMQTLFGVEDVEVITQDGSPCGKKEWLIWNPPLIDEKDPKQGRVSAYAEVSKIFRFLVERGVRTIVFTKVRRTCEIVISQVRKDLLIDHRPDVVEKVMSYRSGYSPEDRRRIEQDMWSGALLGIVATSALELGIDIGSLDAVIMLGFPYSISSLRQQSGRAGRRQKDSLTVLCCDPFPMDQHYARFPEDIFNQPDADLTVDLTNDFVLEGHLQCAAAEMPVHPIEDAPFFSFVQSAVAAAAPGHAPQQLADLCRSRLVPDESGFYHCRNELLPNPAREVAIRGARQVTYSYIDATPGRRGGPRVMEEVEIERAIFEAFEGAVFMHQGLSYVCTDISHDARIARMVARPVNYHTRPRDHTDTDAVETYRIRALRDSASRAYYGKVVVTTHVWGYFKVDRRANILDAVDVDCPPFVRPTRGFWLDVPMWVVGLLAQREINAAAAIHAAEHALLSLTPMFVVSQAGDVRTECKVAEREYSASKPGGTSRKRPARLIFYDVPGQNSGISERAFAHLDKLIRIAVAVIEACACAEGCPGCVTSQTCAHANLVTSKVGALAVLRALIGREPLDEDVHPQDEAGHGQRQGHRRGSDGAGAGADPSGGEGSPALAPTQTQTQTINPYSHTIEAARPPPVRPAPFSALRRSGPGVGVDPRVGLGAGYLTGSVGAAFADELERGGAESADGDEGAQLEGQLEVQVEEDLEPGAGTSAPSDAAADADADAEARRLALAHAVHLRRIGLPGVGLGMGLGLGSQAAEEGGVREKGKGKGKGRSMVFEEEEGGSEGEGEESAG